MRSRRSRNRSVGVTAATSSAVATLLLISVLAPAATAATITVSCPGPPTIQAAVNGAASGDTIDIGAGTCTENITIDKNLTLRGAGAASSFIDGGLAGTVVSVTGGASVELQSLTIRRGSASGGSANGGGVRVTGGSSIALRNVVVTTNAAASNGGGIYNEDGGAVTLIDSSVIGNTAGSNGGGIFSVGTGNVVMITGSSIGGNSATVGLGAGIFLTDSTAVLTRSTVSDNRAGDDGGGIYAVGGGSTTLTNATISGNSANSSSGTGFGGAIFVRDPMLTATHSTIHNNSAFRGGGVAIGGLGVSTAAFRATILSGNLGTSPTAPNPDCSRVAGAGTVVTSGFNLFGPAAPSDCAFTAASTDKVGVDPRLGPLQDNGSPFTHALLAGSPAIDGVSSGCPPPATDERGVTRPQGTYCDIGAYEAPPDLAVPHDVGLVTGDNWQLRDHSTGAVRTITFGVSGDVPIMGDWDCNGTETPGLFRQTKPPGEPNLPEGLAYYRNDNAGGVQNGQFRFVLGNPGDIPLAGDFNGDGCDSLSVYRPSEQKFYIADKLPPPIPLNQPLQAFNADRTYIFGNAGDKPFVGDFNGDGIETVGLHRESTGLIYYLNSHPPEGTSPAADVQYVFGDPGDQLVAGDWVIVDGKWTPALFRSSNATFYFRDDNAPGFKPAAASFPFGTPGSASKPVSGVMGL